MNKVINYFKSNIISIIISLIMTLFSYLLGVILIHNLYIFLETGSELQEIFMQLKTARVVTPIIIPTIIYFFVSMLIIKKKLLNNRTFNIIVKSLIGLFTFIIVFALMVIFSRINDMGLLDTLLSLLENMGGLGL